MRVCFIISGFAYSGAEIVLERYLKNNLSIDPYFILIYEKQDVYKKLCEVYGENKIFKLSIKHNKHRLRLFPMYDCELVKNSISKLIEKINPDIIYANNTMESMILNKYAKISKVPCIAHVHDMKNSIKSIVRRIYTKKSLNNYRKIIMVSEATNKQWGVDRAETIYNGLEKSYFKNDNKDYNSIKKIGVVGTISYRKGSDIVLQLINDICKEELQLNIVYNHGDKKLIDAFKEQQKKYPKNMKIYNNMNAEEIKQFYDNMDIIIVPSRQDPLPTVVIESMARKTIVIGSNTDGLPEMIKDNRLLFDIKSKDEIISKIKMLQSFSNDELCNISELQFKYCKENFNENIKNKKIDNILMSLIS